MHDSSHLTPKRDTEKTGLATMGPQFNENLPQTGETCDCKQGEPVCISWLSIRLPFVYLNSGQNALVMQADERLPFLITLKQIHLY